MKTLHEIIPETSGLALIGDKNVPVVDMALDSRLVKKGFLFCAIPGTTMDGFDYIDAAIKNGAKAILTEKKPEVLYEGITYVVVPSAREATGKVASKFFDKPSQHLKVIGITGTNGKTTTAFLIYDLLHEFEISCGLISTIETRIGTEVEASSLTTPDVINVHRLFRKMLNLGCTHVVMEVSSHALDQKRVDGVQFEIAVFTNISRDHLDYHRDMPSYIKAKKLLFDDLGKNAYGLINVDDKNGRVMMQNSRADMKTYSLRQSADYRSRMVHEDLGGMQMETNGVQWHSRLLGLYNAYNVTAAIAVVDILLDDLRQAVINASKLTPAEGRFDIVRDQNNRLRGIVDYAHTPDALEKILKSIKRLMRPSQKLITVVGCGGDRDKGKRPIMAKSALNYSDQVIITSDNPRSEDPDQIIDEMLDGLTDQDMKKILRITDRQQAIAVAAKLSGGQDIILVAGKGHEKYQEINGERKPFDDKEILKSQINET